MTEAEDITGVGVPVAFSGSGVIPATQAVPHLALRLRAAGRCIRHPEPRRGVQGRTGLAPSPEGARAGP